MVATFFSTWFIKKILCKRSYTFKVTPGTPWSKWLFSWVILKTEASKLNNTGALREWCCGYIQAYSSEGSKSQIPFRRQVARQHSRWSRKSYKECYLVWDVWFKGHLAKLHHEKATGEIICRWHPFVSLCLLPFTFLVFVRVTATSENTSPHLYLTWNVEFSTVTLAGFLKVDFDKFCMFLDRNQTKILAHQT